MPVITKNVLRSDVEHFCHERDRAYSFTEWRPSSTSAWIGKCPQCKHAVRVDVSQEVKLTWEWSPSDKLYVSKRMYRSLPITDGAHYHQSGSMSYVTVPCPYGCLANGYPAHVTCKRIEGRYSESITCSVKCTSATGPHCECQCAGANHGGKHAR